ncbi:MAG: YidH family protein [Mycobacterium sp.]
MSLISTQLSWMRSDLSNLRTLLSWARTSVSMIGFGFTIYNFYRGFLENLATAGRADGARNLGLALVAAGTLAMAVGVLNYHSIAKSLIAMDVDLHVPEHFKHRWVYSYVLSGVVMVIGLITLLFMLRVV